MGGHIRMDKDLEDDPRVARLAEVVLEDWVQRGLPQQLKDEFLSQARNAATGALYALWRYADTHLESGDVTHASVTHLAGVTRTSVTVVTHMPPQWLKIRADGKIELPGFTDKNSLVTKDLRREQNRQRQARFREKTRNARNALPSRKSNARNAPSRGRAHARAQAQPDPVPPNRDRSEETGSRVSAAAELASSSRSLARPIGAEKNGNDTARKSARELEADALKLAATGMGSADIARTLGQFGVTAHQVTLWLANAPAKAS